nr:hypothetical protein [Allomuricauda sp.]
MSANIITDIGERVQNIVIKQNEDMKREKNRGLLAILFVVLFFIVIFVTFWVGYNTEEFSIQHYKDLLTTVSSILSGPLGFIIGFYFKERQVEEQKREEDS